MRRVIYESHFDQKLKAIQPDFERADAFLQGVEWALRRDPTLGDQVKGTNVWCIPAADVFPQPLSILYTFDESTVWMLSIEAVMLDDDDEWF
ncbi:MAG: hypothetical protein M3552_02105 [Planctomycetota bacterium]|nr:hypothetical protein [Planctomycetota bacterium]